MSTRSIIAVEREGVVRGIYCHMDGYPDGPDGVGYKLHRHWHSDIKAARIVMLGDLSSLGTTLHNSKRMDAEVSGNAYDFRIPAGAIAETWSVEAHAMWELVNRAWNTAVEYVYLFHDGKWLYRPTPGTVAPRIYQMRLAIALAATCRPHKVAV